MPTNRTKRKRSANKSFSNDDAQYLLVGENLDHLPGDPPYPEERAERLWQKKGSEVIRYWIQPKKNAHINDYFTEKPPGPFHRPFGWWKFEAPDDLEGNRHTDIREYLQENDLLTETEQKRLNK